MNMIPRLVKNEQPVSCQVNIIAQYDDVTLQDKNDHLIQIIKVNGLNSVTQGDRILDAYKKRINHMLKNISSEFALYSYELRRKNQHYSDGNFENGYAKDLNDRYRGKVLSSSLFMNEIYLAVITKQPEGIINKGFSFITQFFRKFDEQAKDNYLRRRHQELCEMTQKLMNTLSGYGCELLSVYERDGTKYSAPLEFVSTILNGCHYAYPVVNMDVAEVLPRKRLTFDHRSGTVALRSPDGSHNYAAMLAIKGYASATETGMLNEISKLNCEYTITQSFRFYDRQSAKGKLRDQQMEMAQSKDESISQTDEIDESFDEAASGEVALGQHHFTLCLYSDTPEELNRQVSRAVAKFSDLDIACVREDTGCECAYWSQLPANFRYILRSAMISTRNFAGFASLHNTPRGKANDNHWGEAVTVLETTAGTPYHFNFHHRDVGNFQIFGAMGSGKTVLTGFLLAQSMKFGGKRIIFDKDRGLEIFVRAMGGVYEQLKPGVATGFNPCQLTDTPENRAFLVQLFKHMLTTNHENLTEADSAQIIFAVNGMYRLPLENRQLREIAPYFGTRRPGSLRQRFDQWHSDGEYAWLFDNKTDSLSLEADVLGFDLGKILTHRDCSTPALMYLIHRVEQSLIGKRGIIFCDEGWSMLNEPYFRTLIENWARTPRKKDIIFGLATQVANDTVSSAISKSINESAFCKIFFPNPSADRDVYINHYGLSEHEYELVRSMTDENHYFLLVHGHGANRQSVVVRLMLDGMLEDLAVISARESSLIVMDNLRDEMGDDPKRWLPVFIEKMRKAA